MKALLRSVAVAIALFTSTHATTLSVCTIYEPLSLHGTDSAEALRHSDKALAAAVASRQMVLSGALPEVLVESIRTPQKLPSNDPDYMVTEANLLLLCQIGIEANVIDTRIEVNLDVSKFSIPSEVDLTQRQVMKLVIVAVRKTLEEYQSLQTGYLKLAISIHGTVPENADLKELNQEFLLSGAG